MLQQNLISIITLILQNSFLNEKNLVQYFLVEHLHQTLICSGCEYLILCSDQNKSNIINNLNENLKTSFYALTDVSDYYLTMRLSGPKSIEVLSKACPLNFEKNLLKKNSCAQSYISKATVLIDRLSDEPIFDISVRWSFAEYRI